MKNLESLLSKVLSGKYYHVTHFTIAGNKRNSSLKAILKERLCKKGLIQLIGDESTFRVWEEPWIP
jgi:hypothetical protein